MAEQEYVVNSSFLLKRGFAKDWEKLNPLLKQGEIGFILDQNAIKIGDGVTLWNALPIVGDDEFGKFENKIREELEKGWKKPVRFTKSVAIGSAEASGAGSFAMGEYKPLSVKNGWDYNYVEKSDIRRLTEEEAERLYEYTGVYYEYVSLNDNIDNESLQQAIYFVDTEQLVHITESVCICWHLDNDEEDESRDYDFFNIKEGETIDTNYSGPVAYFNAYSGHYESDIRSLTEDEQNAIFEKTGIIYLYIDQSGSMPEEQYITISRPIEKTIHVTESKFVEIEDEFNGSDLVYGDVFNIAEGENIETPCYTYGYEYSKDDHNDYDHYKIHRLTNTAKELVYNETGKYYEYIDLNDQIKDDSAPTIELYDIERYGHAVTQSEYIESGPNGGPTGRVFNIEDDVGFKAPYKGIMLYNYCPVEMAIDLENYGPTAVASGELAFAQGDQVVAEGNCSHAEGNYTKASGWASHAEGNNTTASGNQSHAEGVSTTASGNYSHAEGYNTQATKICAHSEGIDAVASGNYSHAEGYGTTASNSHSHAEGNSTLASGTGSHTEGYGTTASNSYSHAEGHYSRAKGQYSHAEGRSTIAAGEAQHVQGKYNIEDAENKHAFIIGNGTDSNNRSNAFTVDWNGDAKLNGYLDALGLKGDTVTRNLYVGGARKANGEWQPDGGFVVDHTPLNSTIKNEACISTLKVNEEGNYALTAPNGSNNLYKIQVIENGNTKTLDINQLPTITAGTYSDGYGYSAGNGFWITFGSKTKIEAHNKTFTDGTTCYKRLSYQQGLKYDKYNSGENPYPAVTFYTNGPATIKIWWVAGDANRYFAIQHRYENSGSARLEVTGNFVAHGPSDFKGTARFEDVVIDGRLETRDIHVHGFIEASESIECGGSIKVDSEIKAGGTATFENDVKIKNNSNREHTVKLRDALHEALDFDFKKRIPFSASEIGGSNDLKTNIDNMRNISATTLTLDQEEYTFDIGETIDLYKDFTLKGITEKPVEVTFNYTGTDTEFVLFRAQEENLKIGLENLIVNITGIGLQYFEFFDNNEMANSNFSIKKCETYEENSLYSYTEGIGTTASESPYSLDICDYLLRVPSVPIKPSHAEGFEAVASTGCAHAEGYRSKALNFASHTEGRNTVVAGYTYPGNNETDYYEGGGHAEGNGTYVGGSGHAEGAYTYAGERGAHAEGIGTRAEGFGAHAEGRGLYSYGSVTSVLNDNKIQIYLPGNKNSALRPGALGRILGEAEFFEVKKITSLDDWGMKYEIGYSNYYGAPFAPGQEILFIYEKSNAAGACGDYSHCEGDATVTLGYCQHAQGKFNLPDENTYAHIVGNGIDHDSRSNAHTLDWDGNAWFSGDVYTGSTSGTNKDEGSKKLATEDFVTEKVSTIEAIAKGRATGYVFDTKADLDAWLLVEENVSKLNLGDNLYIRAKYTPDYWWDGTAIQELETQNVAIENYYTKSEVDAIVAAEIAKLELRTTVDADGNVSVVLAKKEEVVNG